MNRKPPTATIIFIFTLWLGGSTSTLAQQYLQDSDNGVRLVDVTSLDSTFVLDIRYATTNNFTEKQMYDCGKCYLREPVAELLIQAQEDFREMGYRIKLFDCYRPRPIQYKLWEVVPDARYVARPWVGSVHNRGGAVDLTLVDENGNELEMGTDYDFFGEESHQDFTDLPENVLENRALLKKVMQKHSFSPIRTEWWHFDYNQNKLYPLSDLVWDCN